MHYGGDWCFIVGARSPAAEFYPPALGEVGRVWQGSGGLNGFGRLWEASERFARAWEDLGAFCKGLGGSRKVCEALGGFGGVWGSLEGSGMV